MGTHAALNGDIFRRADLGSDKRVTEEAGESNGQRLRWVQPKNQPPS